MKSWTKAAIFILIISSLDAGAADKLVLDLEMDKDLLSLNHNIDGFLFKPTMNFSANTAGNLSELFAIDPLKNNLVATALIRINGVVAGYATEQEALVVDSATGHPIAESAWLITLNYPGANGVLAVVQQENAGPVFAQVKEVMENPDQQWEDKFQRFLSSSNAPKVQMATGELAIYQGGRFEEYNFLNPADFSKFGRFRAKIQFVIYPAE